MKTAAIILVLLMSAKQTLANGIDSLKTKDDVQKFIVKVNPDWKDYDFFEETNKNDTSAYGKGKFFKLDLDNNGLTDLVINGKYLFAITDNGNGHYETHFIDRGAFMNCRYTLKNIIYKNKTPLLVIKKVNEFNFEEDSNIKMDTLVFKFNDFYEYNPTSDNLKVEEINFSTSGCFGTCPIFQLNIKADRTAKYDAQRFNSDTGKFKTIIDTASYSNLLQAINYIELTSLKDNYEVNWTDDQTATLEIKFNNGQTKKISDYGMIGTFGLEGLYNQLFDLRKTQKWVKSD